jgi:hypothetical protein
MSSFVKSFKSFQTAEKKAAEEVTAGANPQMIEEDDTALLTDPALIQIRDQKRNLEKQLEQIKQQEDVKLKELTAKAAQSNQQAKAAQNAAVNQPAATPAPATPTA